MRLGDLLPLFAEEIEGLLEAKGEKGLAAQIRDLRIVDRCRCPHDYCGSFYTQPKPRGPLGQGHRRVEVDPVTGIVIFDVVDGRILQINVLFRDKVRKILHAAIL